MKMIFRQVGRNWIGALGCLALGGGALGWLFFHHHASQPVTAQISSPQQIHPAGAVKPGVPLTPFAVTVNIPANASPEMKEFLENRATLANNMAQFRKQNVNGAADPKAFAEFRKQNEALFKRQSELAQAMGQQQARNPMPEPPPLHLPPNASPQLQAFLTARDQMMRDQVAFMNQHQTDDPATRQAAMQQWRQQNATRFQQLQQLAQNMSHPITPTAPH